VHVEQATMPGDVDVVITLALGLATTYAIAM
jgi:hypothetical protein